MGYREKMNRYLKNPNIGITKKYLIEQLEIIKNDLIFDYEFQFDEEFNIKDGILKITCPEKNLNKVLEWKKWKCPILLRIIIEPN